MLVSTKARICVSPNGNFKICTTPNAKPQRQSLEYRLDWVPNIKSSRWPCTFLFLLVLISFALGPVFSVEYGLKVRQHRSMGDGGFSFTYKNLN